MKVVFCGTPDFAVPSLEAILAAGHDVLLVLTQPDKRAGRKLEMSVSPVKRAALERGLAVMQPDRLKTNAELRGVLEELQPEAIVVVAYGRLIPPWMLELPHFGNINVHGSLLPKYRGAAPIQWAVANGETETGVTTMRLDSGLDTGNVLLDERMPIGPDTTAADLFAELADVGAKAIVRTLAGLADGTLDPRGTPQNNRLASLAPILTRDDGRLDLEERTANEAYNRFRGFYPWPGAHGIFRDKRFLVHSMCVAEDADLAEGELALRGKRLLVGAAQGTALELKEVQVEGKPRIAGPAFARDFQLKPGERVD